MYWYVWRPLVSAVLRRAGEIEGLSIDPVNDDLVVLNNRGTQIILGMSQGPLTEEGYKGEIH